MAGAPKGNQNAAKAKVWTAAIERALERRKPANERIKAIDELADKILDAGFSGDLAALKEIGDRLEGKPTATVAGDPERPIFASPLILVESPLVSDGTNH